MKKLNLTLAIIFITVFAQGQIYLYQGFGSGYWPPEGWTSLPMNSHWSANPTDNAGGISPEARFEGFDYNGTVRLISPYIDMTDADTAILSFRYFTDAAKTGTPVLGVSTRTGSGTWSNAWETTIENFRDPREFEVLITGENLGNPDFQFSFFIVGDMNMIHNLYLDNVKLYYPTGPDAKLDEILTPYEVELPVPAVARVINLGNTTMNQVGVTFLTSRGVLHDTILTDLGLGLYDSFIFQFNRWWVSPLGEYNLKMWISSVNGEEDPYHPNDTLVKKITYQRFHPRRMPCFESFTSSVDDNSVWFGNQFYKWCQNNPDEVTISYALEIPGEGDLYYIPDNDTRREYYDVNFVPRTFCNGTFAASIDTLDIQVAYDTATKLLSSFEILSSYRLIGDSIIIATNIFPHESMSGTSVHTMIKEKITTGNNGQRDRQTFHDNVMKMFPGGGYGQQMDFSNGIPMTMNFASGLGDTHIEELGDIAVAVFVQQDSNREILQAAYAIKDAVYETEDRLSMILLDGVPLEGFDPDIHTYQVQLPAGTTEPPVTSGITMQDSAFMLIAQAFEMPGYAVIDSYPEGLGSFKRYIVHFSFITDIDDPQTQQVGIFPNPVANGKLFITGIESPRIKLFSLDGKLVFENERCPDNMIDLSGLQKGLYLVNLTDHKGNTYMKKIVVM
jgi:hypothetical protein